MSKFQIALLFIFGFFILVAVLVFSLYRGSSSTEATVTIWGSISSSNFNNFLNKSDFGQGNKITVHYVEKPANTLESDFTEALAQGGGPDLVILREDELWKTRAKLLDVPFSSFSQRDFQNTFVEGAEIFLSPTGFYALPLSVDPMILYYNRNLLSAAGIAKPLAYWDEIYASAAKLTHRDPAGNIVQSTIALGETRNIPLAKDILSLLLLQAGTPITGLIGGELRSELTQNFGLPVAPAESALDFYTQFGNPSKPFYSWNRTLPEAETSFTSGDTAYYLGFASELANLQRKSPTLNFTLAPVPQSRVAGKKITLGRFYGVALSRGTHNPSVALETALRLVSNGNDLALANVLSLPPVRRDLLSAMPTDAVGPVFYDAALQAHAWLDPDPDVTKTIFTDTIEAVTSGRFRIVEALNAANRRLEEIIKN